MEVKQTGGIRYAHTNVVAHDWRAIADFYIEVFDCVPVGPERDQTIELHSAFAERA